MEPPATFPADEADLAEWAVYADDLLTRGDPRGELLAHELALPAAPEREAVAAFQALASRFCRQGGHAPIGWCLGHARTLTIVGWQPRFKGPAAVDAGTLANVHQLLLRPIGARLEQLGCVYTPREEPKAWRRVFSALPATCRRVSVTPIGEWSESDVDELVAWLPATVDELAIMLPRVATRAHVARFVTDRFAVIELEQVRPDSVLEPQVAAAFAATRTLRLRVDQLDLARRIASDRCRVGSLSAAGLVTSRGIGILEPWSLLELQGRYGLVPVRAQRARLLPEDHALWIDVHGHVGCGSLHGAPPDLVRRGTRWTIRPSDHLRVWRSGQLIEAITELHHDDQLSLQQLESDWARGRSRVDCTFVHAI